ncbi:MAG TPA: hypothetical protein VJN67_07910 [Stellaceae bacterium]|nr:hypothetical protein [Stellaceae bacterium]
MADVTRFALGLALVLGLLASPLVTGKAVAKSHVSVGIGFGGPVYGAPYYVPPPVYAVPYYTAPPVYYAPGPVYTPPTYGYPPRTVIVPSPGYYGQVHSWQGEDEDDDD